MSGLHKACRYGNIKKVRLFIDLGVDIEAKGNYGRTPLHVASI